MTSFLTFAVTGVRISGEIPVQSEYLPLINLYILLSILYTLFGFIWFIIAKQLSDRHHLPLILVKIAFIVKKVFYCFYKEKSENFVQDESIEKISDNEKCNYGIDCKHCEKKLEKKKKSDAIKNELKVNVSALNLLAFLILFLIIFTCNLGIWIAMNTD